MKFQSAGCFPRFKRSSKTKINEASSKELPQSVGKIAKPTIYEFIESKSKNR